MHLQLIDPFPGLMQHLLQGLHFRIPIPCTEHQLARSVLLTNIWQALIKVPSSGAATGICTE